MGDKKEFSHSSNGDRWFLLNDSHGLMVLHKANEPSGGYERRITVEDFLAEHEGKPEQTALLQLLGQSQAQVDEHFNDEKLEASSAIIAAQYLELGGRREITIECDVVSIRIREDEPAEAEKFWQANIEQLPAKEWHEIAIHLSREDGSTKTMDAAV